jgi:hypothetical protein
MKLGKLLKLGDLINCGNCHCDDTYGFGHRMSDYGRSHLQVLVVHNTLHTRVQCDFASLQIIDMVSPFRG